MSRIGEFANIYELLDESDSSGVETGKKAQVALEQKKAAQAAALAPSQPPKSAATQGAKPQGQRPSGERRNDRAGGDNRGPRTDRPREDRPPRSDRPREDRPPRSDRPREDRPPRTDRPPRAPRAEGQEGEASFTGEGQAAAGGAPRPHVPRDQRSGPRPDRGYERRRPGDQDQRPGKREFDRRSGTGRGKETAKGGAGKGGWGSVEDEAAVNVEGASATALAAEAAAPADGAAEGEAAAAPAAEAPAEAAPAEEEEPPVRTLDDYLKEKQTKAKAALPQRRQAGEGEDSEAWKGFTTFQKEEESLFAVEKTSKDKANKEAKEKAEKKVAADQVLRFQQERREREDRGDRGDRGDRAERGPRGPRGPKEGSAPKPQGQRRGNNTSAPNFEDASHFPTLSQKA